MFWLSLGANFLGHTKDMMISTQSLFRLWFFILLMSRRLHSLSLISYKACDPRKLKREFSFKLFFSILLQVIVNIFSGFGCWEGIFEIHTKHVTCSQIKSSSLFYKPENYSGKRLWFAKWKLQFLTLKTDHWKTRENASVSVCRYSKTPLGSLHPQALRWVQIQMLVQTQNYFPTFLAFYVE